MFAHNLDEMRASRYPPLHNLEVAEPERWTPRVAGPVLLEGKGDATVERATPQPQAPAVGEQEMEDEQKALEAQLNLVRQVARCWYRCSALMVFCVCTWPQALTEQKVQWVPGFSFGAAARKAQGLATRAVPGPGQYDPCVCLCCMKCLVQSVTWCAHSGTCR